MNRVNRMTRALGLALLAGLLGCGAAKPDDRELVAGYLRPDPYPRLVVELDAVEGLALADDVVGPLLLALDGLVDKPGGIELVVDDSLPASAGRDWTFAELEQLAEQTFDLEVEPDTIKIHVLLLDGSYHESDGDELLGLAWGHRHAALFQLGIQAACSTGNGGKGLSSKSCRSAELGVLAHEIGHVIGLVNNGVPMVEDHEDPEHPNHTRDSDCLMYWAYERRAVVTKIQDAIDAGAAPEEALGCCPPSLADLAAY